MPSFSRVKWTNSPTTQQHILEDWNHQIFNLLDLLYTETCTIQKLVSRIEL